MSSDVVCHASANIDSASNLWLWLEPRTRLHTGHHSDSQYQVVRATPAFRMKCCSEGKTRQTFGISNLLKLSHPVRLAC